MPMSEYVRKLRAKVGHDLLIVPTVTVLTFDEHDRVLLVRHTEGNIWVAPGGMIEPGETPAHAATREMLEETGHRVELSQLLGVFGGPDFRMTYKNGDVVEFVMTIFEARTLETGARSDVEEILELRYCTEAEIATLTTGRWLPIVLRHIRANRTGASFQSPGLTSGLAPDPD